MKVDWKKKDFEPVQNNLKLFLTFLLLLLNYDFFCKIVQGIDKLDLVLDFLPKKMMIKLTIVGEKKKRKRKEN